jgi:predicted methyltransferase
LRTRFAVLLAAAALSPLAIAAAPSPKAALATAIADPARSEADRARDKYRHPAETLAFFGVKPGQTVVEYQPAAGWYAQILAPMLRGNGRYVPLAAGTPQAQENLSKLIAANGARFGSPTPASIDIKAGTSSVPAGSADVVLTFRNVHNMLMAGDEVPPKAFAAFFAMLKPGGTLGVVDHRLPESMDGALQKTSGYMKRSTIIGYATAAGFRLAGESAVNANPKDTHEYPKGVWTLPPTYREGDADRARYAAIGESDRLTLKFVKPRA